jgi:hypothetical protein
MSIALGNDCLYGEIREENSERGYSMGFDDSGTNVLHC